MSDSFNVGDAYIELRLRQDKLQKDSSQLSKVLGEQQAQLASVAKKAEHAGDRLNQAFGGKLVEMAARGLAVMGTVELGIGAVNVASDVLSGNFEDAAEAVKKLPAGIGPLARQIDSLLGSVTGITAEIERIKAVNDAMNLAIDRQVDSAQTIQKIEQSRVATLRELADELERLRADPSDRPFIEARQQAEARVAAAKEELQLAKDKAAISDKDRASIQQINDSITKLKEQRDNLGKIAGVDTSDITKVASFPFLGAASLGLPDDPLGKTGVRQSKEDVEAEITRKISLLTDSADKIRKIAEDEKQSAVAAAEEKLRKVLEVTQAIGDEITDQERKASEDRLRNAEQDAEKRRQAAEQEAKEQLRIARETAVEQDRIRQGEIDRLDRMIKLRSEVIQKDLRLQGRGLEAEADRILQDARAQAERAKSADEVDLIKQSAGLDIETLIRNAREKAGGIDSRGVSASITSLEAAIGNLQSAALQREDPSLAQRREQISLQKKAVDELVGVKKAVQDIKPTVAVGP